MVISNKDINIGILLQKTHTDDCTTDNILNMYKEYNENIYFGHGQGIHNIRILK